MNCFNALERKEVIKQAKSEAFDLIIIGGGITGAGIALDASTRGLKVLLLEKNDFASGTSSKSTKLIHGGLRYLKQFEIALVREVGQERAVVHKLAPHLVKSEKMLLPLIKDGTYGKILTSFGLMVYDVLAGVEKVDQRKMLSREETLEIEPLLKDDILEGGGIYAEYRTDDARLTIEILKTAAQNGAVILNYAEALDFIYHKNKITGVTWRDNLAQIEIQSKGKITVSAAGPWVDKLRGINHSLEGKHLRPTKGVHIVLPKERLPIQQAVYFDVAGGRMLFAIPRDRVTYVGTTDTEYDGDLDKVRTDLVDVEYLVNGVNQIFPSVQLQVEDVESTWVGLRPLIAEEGKSASELSRKDEIFESETGLISIAGGKLTGYRKMAERIVDRVAKRINFKVEGDIPSCKTEKIILMGGVFKNAREVEKYIKAVGEKLAPHQLAYMAEYLVSNYGRQCDNIITLFEKQKYPNPEVNLGMAELVFTVENEAVHSLLDFFERRTGRLYFNIRSIDLLVSPATDYLAAVFGWDAERVRQETYWLQDAIKLCASFE